MRVSTETLARAAARRPWRTLGVWAVVVVLSLAVVATLLGSALTTEGDVTVATESKRADELLAERLPRTQAELDEEVTEFAVVRSDSLDADDPAFGAVVEDLSAAMRAAGAVAVTSYYETGSEALVSVDGDTALLLVALGPEPEDVVEDVVAAVEDAGSTPGFEARITGEWSGGMDFTQLSQDDLEKGELFFGLPAALVILLFVFGTVVAGLVPLVLALLAILVAVALTALVGQAFELSFFVVNMISGMGLALGIDYSLFILSRFREERLDGREKIDAIVTAGATASRAVLFSGIAFILAMVGMVLVPDTILRSLAVGAILVAICAVAGALTLLPALLSLLGDRVNALKLPLLGRSAAGEAGREGRFWTRIVHAVMRRPFAYLAVAGGLMLALAVPVVDLNMGFSGIATLPDRFQSKQGFLLLNEEFPGETTQPVTVVVDGDPSAPDVEASLARLEEGIASEPAFGRPQTAAQGEASLAVLTFPVAGDPTGETAIDAVERLRAEIVPAATEGSGAEALVTGGTAEAIDYFDLVGTWLPRVFVFVLGLSFLLLTVAFRSIVVPATAICMNLLSVGAAYGLLVLVFQKGVGNEIFGFEQVDTIEAWVPLFLFSVLFGLSMDYQVFLLSRIRERYSQTGDNADAVAHGVGTTARIITGAALIIIAVFAGFARGDLIMFQQMGFGVAVALLLDATVIRSVVVPATMTILGRWNWYLPSWLAWIPDVHVEGHEGPEPRPAPTRSS
ncbi:MAG TPA: MMPL family transporter [Gaiellaceae bacterium]|nr:MMPL family transporter [Gaiellaceae bacterium]